jgi:hypothetical protein
MLLLSGLSKCLDLASQKFSFQLANHATHNTSALKLRLIDLIILTSPRSETGVDPTLSGIPVLLKAPP